MNLPLPAEVEAALNDPHYPRPWSVGPSQYGRWPLGIYSEVDGIKRFFFGSHNLVWLNDIVDEAHKRA
jgi:hypothetical protein